MKLCVCHVIEIHVDLAHPHNIEGLKIVGFSDALLSALTNRVNTPKKKGAIEKVLEFGKKFAVDTYASTTESSFSFENTSQPTVQTFNQGPNSCSLGRPSRSNGELQGAQGSQPRDLCHSKIARDTSRSSIQLEGWTQRESSHRASVSSTRRVSQASMTTTASPITPVVQHSPGVLTVLSPGYKKKASNQETTECSQNAEHQSQDGTDNKDNHEPGTQKNGLQSQTAWNPRNESNGKAIRMDTAPDQGEASNLQDNQGASSGHIHEMPTNPSTRTSSDAAHQERDTIVVGACNATTAPVPTSCPQTRTESLLSKFSEYKD